MIAPINFALRMMASTASQGGKIQAIQKIAKMGLPLKKQNPEFIQLNGDKIINVLRYIANQMQQTPPKTLGEALDNAANTYRGVVYLFSSKEEFKNFFLFIWNELSKTPLL